jgi:predicted metal-dependent hydrolase
MRTNTELRNVPCECGVIEYQLTRKAVKNINLRIEPDGRILISANTAVPVGFIDGFVCEKQEYIIKALEKYKENRKYASPAPRQYASGESFDILGKRLQLQVMQGNQESVWTDGEFIFLTVKGKENLKRKEKLINAWLKNLELETFQQICMETYEIFKPYGVPYPELKIRCMTSCWGSCRPKRGVITLNSKLIEAPRYSIEYVVLHEFAHFIHPDHSKKFYEFVSMLMPDWKERKAVLERRV